MTFDEFINKWNNRGIDFDGYYGDQCMDLMHQYHVEVLGITDGRTLAAASAKDVYLNFNSVYNNQLFDRIANTPTGVPQKGDIILWGTGIGPYGHVAVYIDGDANKFRSFDQNFPTGSKCHIQSHDYTGVLGWLRSKAKPNEEVVCDKKSVRDMLVAKATQRDDVCTYLGLSTDQSQTDSNKITSTIGGFKSRITDLTNQVAGANAEVSNREEQVSRLKSDLLASEGLKKSLTDSLNEATSKVTDVQGVYEGQLSQKQTVIDQYAKDKGQLQIEVAQLNAQLNEVKKNSVKAMSINDLITLLFAKIGGNA